MIFVYLFPLRWMPVVCIVTFVVLNSSWTNCTRDLKGFRNKLLLLTSSDLHWFTAEEIITLQVQEKKLLASEVKESKTFTSCSQTAVLMFSVCLLWTCVLVLLTCFCTWVRKRLFGRKWPLRSFPLRFVLTDRNISISEKPPHPESSSPLELSLSVYQASRQRGHRHGFQTQLKRLTSNRGDSDGVKCKT